MNRAGLLQETTAWMDTVDLALCLFIYEVCNDYQFEYLSGSDFVNFLNLKPSCARKRTFASVTWCFPSPVPSGRESAGNSGRKSS